MYDQSMSSVVGGVAAKVSTAGSASEVGSESWPWAELTEAASDIAGHLNAQHGRLIDLASRLIADPVAWAGEGMWTPEQFLVWRCGIGAPLARRVVAAARRAGELPVSIGAVRCGELSIDQLGSIVRHVPGWADEQAVSLAKRCSVGQIQRTMSRYRFDRHRVRMT